MIEISDLTYRYKGKSPLFQQLNLMLNPGNIYGLLGKNGAGKSTLLKLISGLLFPQQGDIRVVDHRPSDRYPQFLREVYFLSEEFDLPDFTIKQYVQKIEPFYPRFNTEAFDQYMEEFKLPYDQKLQTLSYGQKKKFLLSFGLATDCKLLILDEPTNGIDIPSKSLFRKLVANAIHEDRTFIISTHQVKDMENLIDPLIVLDEGEIIFNETYESIVSRIAVRKVSELPDERVLYSESQLGGYTVVMENMGEEETNLNLELLFNAVIQSKEKFHAVFNAKSEVL